MKIPDHCREVMREGQAIQLAEEDIYSVLPDHSQHHLYDGRAAAYDLVVGTRAYNRVMWGAALQGYVAFARQAVASDQTGILLDAGCGSLLFTAQAYLESRRPIIACDQSLNMLRRARSRLMKLAGAVPDRVVLLQADLGALPFSPNRFSTVLCMNVLHHVVEAQALIARLKELLLDGGHFYLTSLVKGDRFIGDRYLDVLYRRGDFASPRSMADVATVLGNSFGRTMHHWVDGNMGYATATRGGERSTEH
ncbi:MAG TPA: class I SAM-dependent methyltransferase [Gemmatimonadaceae bacterium]